jgi:hypothetical protein
MLSTLFFLDQLELLEQQVRQAPLACAVRLEQQDQLEQLELLAQLDPQVLQVLVLQFQGQLVQPDQLV